MLTVKKMEEGYPPAYGIYDGAYLKAKMEFQFDGEAVRLLSITEHESVAGLDTCDALTRAVCSFALNAGFRGAYSENDELFERLVALGFVRCGKRVELPDMESLFSHSCHAKEEHHGK